MMNSAHTFEHPILRSLQENGKITDAIIDDGKMQFRYFKSFVSGGVEINAVIPEGTEIDELAVELCHEQLKKEQEDLAEDIWVREGQLVNIRRSHEIAVARLKSLFQETS